MLGRFTSRALRSPTHLRYFAREIPAVYPEGSIYKRNEDDIIFRDVHFQPEAAKGAQEDPWPISPEFRTLVNQLFALHRPSNHPLFENLKKADPSVVKNTGFLREFYTRYQAAMHCTRAAVYFAPYLNTPELRQRKIAILGDDDTVGGPLSHHQQLKDMFTRFGATDLPDNSFFGDNDELANKLDKDTARFVRTVDPLYRETTGAWTIAEVLSDDWLSALARAFEPTFPDVMQEQYFDEVLTGHVEILHMLETVSLTESILDRKPHLKDLTFHHARVMCDNLDGLWSNLDNLVANPEPYLD